MSAGVIGGTGALGSEVKTTTKNGFPSRTKLGGEASLDPLPPRKLVGAIEPLADSGASPLGPKGGGYDKNSCDSLSSTTLDDDDAVPLPKPSAPTPGKKKRSSSEAKQQKPAGSLLDTTCSTTTAAPNASSGSDGPSPIRGEAKGALQRERGGSGAGRPTPSKSADSVSSAPASKSAATAKAVAEKKYKAVAKMHPLMSLLLPDQLEDQLPDHAAFIVRLRILLEAGIQDATSPAEIRALGEKFVWMIYSAVGAEEYNQAILDNATALDVASKMGGGCLSDSESESYSDMGHHRRSDGGDSEGGMGRGGGGTIFGTPSEGGKGVPGGAAAAASSSSSSSTAAAACRAAAGSTASGIDRRRSSADSAVAAAGGGAGAAGGGGGGAAAAGSYGSYGGGGGSGRRSAGSGTAPPSPDAMIGVDITQWAQDKEGREARYRAAQLEAYRIYHMDALTEAANAGWFSDEESDGDVSEDLSSEKEDEETFDLEV